MVISFTNYKNKIPLFYFLFISVLFFGNKLKAQPFGNKNKAKINAIESNVMNVSNEGTEFWAVFPTHVPDAQLANISIFITTKSASSGIIKVGNFKESFTVSASKVTEIKVPREQAYIDFVDNGKVLPNRAIQILVDSGMPNIVVYAHIFASRRSAASLILPVQGLGNEYFSFNYPQYEKFEGKNFITVIATKANTKIIIKKSSKVLTEFTLNNIGDVFEYLSDDDLTGVKVTSYDYKNFAVFSGNTAVRIASKNCVVGKNISLDPLYQQCYPVKNWGNMYGCIPFSTKSPNSTNAVRTVGQILRVIAKESNTEVSINGAILDRLQEAGNFATYYTNTVFPFGYGFGYTINEPFIIWSDKPISVAQYALSQSCSNVIPDTKSYSDPDMVILNPIEYNTKNVTLYSSDKEHITEQYINIFIKTTGVSSFRINGLIPTTQFKEVAANFNYSYLQINLNDYKTNVYNLTSSEGFNAVAYGFGDVESYAYSAGTNLASNQFVSGVRQVTNKLIDSACVNDEYYFKLTLPHPAQRIIWEMDSYEKPIEQINPTAKIITNNNITTYEYIMSKTAAYKISGVHTIKVNASSVYDFYNPYKLFYEFTVLPLPIVEFTSTIDSCLNVLKFKDNNPNQLNIASRLWNFGDSLDNPNNYTSIIKETVHTYKKSGKYKAKLTLTSASGCVTYQEKNIEVKASPMPLFKSNEPFCVNNTITLTDITPLHSSFKVKKWYWNFGDGESLYALNDNPVQHTYKTAGDFNISLILINDKDCQSHKKDSIIKINPLPVSNFIADKVCINDEFTNFLNQSTLPTNSPPDVLTYFWDFGDPFAIPTNPNFSTEKNPKHKYLKDSSYVVKLTTSMLTSGCSNTISNIVNVNSNVLKADFELPSSGKICHGQLLALKNLSTLTGFGVIEKIEIYFDYENKPAFKETFTKILPDQLYTHIYSNVPPKNTSKNYLIKLIAYSGNNCFAEKIKTITIIPKPKLVFDTIPNICISSSPTQLYAKETNGIKGDGKYMGSGISVTGLFNPNIAGEGVHELKYKFTSDEGCIDSTTQKITVFNPPVITPLPDIIIPESETVIIQPNVTGNNLNYFWQPSTGLKDANTRNPSITGINDIVYTLTASNGVCESTQNFIITVLRKLELYNTFTPNNDGVNDVWNIKNVNKYPNINVEIFNRYGIKLFESIGYTIPWDGTFNNQPVPAGTYYYVINLGNGKTKMSGFITLVR